MIKPLADKVIVLPDPRETERGGVLIPEGSRERTQSGTVVAVSEEVKKLKMEDKVLYSKYAGVETVIEGTMYLVFREIDIFATNNP